MKNTFGGAPTSLARALCVVRFFSGTDSMISRILAVSMPLRQELGCRRLRRSMWAPSAFCCLYRFHTRRIWHREQAKVLAACLRRACRGPHHLCCLREDARLSDASVFRPDCCGALSPEHFQKLASPTQDENAFNRRWPRGSSVCWLVGCHERGCNIDFLEKLVYESSNEIPMNPMEKTGSKETQTSKSYAAFFQIERIFVVGLVSHCPVPYHTQWIPSYPMDTVPYT